MEWMIVAAGAVGLAAAGLICGFLVWIFTRIVAGFWPSFPAAVAASLVAALTGLVLQWAAFKTMGISPGTNLACMAAGLALQAMLYGEWLKDPEKGPIGFGKGVLVALLLFGAVSVLLLFRPAGPRPEFKTAWAQRYQELLHRPADAGEPGESPGGVEAGEAQREAVRLYPALGVAGSPFNEEFCKRYRRYRQEQPGFFDDPAWPLRLAGETKEALLPK